MKAREGLRGADRDNPGKSAAMLFSRPPLVQTGKAKWLSAWPMLKEIM